MIDQSERAPMESSIDPLNWSKISGSESAEELARKNESTRERKKAVAIGALQ